jgi:hypothetical protein
MNPRTDRTEIGEFAKFAEILKFLKMIPGLVRKSKSSERSHKIGLEPETSLKSSVEIDFLDPNLGAPKDLNISLQTRIDIGLTM